MMMTMITVKEYLMFMGAQMSKESNSCMEQYVTYKTNGMFLVDSGLAKLSFILGLLNSV